MPKGAFCRINVAYPTTGASKSFMVEDFRKMQALHGLRMSSEFDGAVLGEEYAGCLMKVTGGNDGQGFPMMQGVLRNQRVRLLLNDQSKCYRALRDGQNRRKSVRGCIVGPDLHALSVVMLTPGEKEVPGLTDTTLPKRLVPKRASKIRRLFGLPSRKVKKEDQALVRNLIKELGREVTLKSGKTRMRYPKIQRLVTDNVHARKVRAAQAAAQRKELAQAAKKEYAQLLRSCAATKFAKK